MNKSILIAIPVVIIIGIVTVYYESESAVDKSNLGVQRHLGTVDTSMGSPILGNINAPITIIEFGDYQCPQCDRWFHEVRPSIEDNYIKTGKANLIFVDLAFFGPDSTKAAEATYCAADQGKYWEYHNILYSNQGSINSGWASSGNLKIFAFQIGLNMDLFGACLDEDTYKKRVEHNIQVAKNSGANETPTFIIINTEVQQEITGAQPFSAFKQTIDRMI